MKKKTIWGYPRLCLCLIFSLSMVSCAIKKGIKTAHSCPQNQVWRVEIIITPNDTGYRIPESISTGLISIEPVMSGNAINSAQPQMLLLSFRVYGLIQLQSLREKLCAMSIVRSINIISLSN
jgi:hypothetical protein